MNNSITECLLKCYTHILSFDQINNINGVGMPLVMNGKERTVASNFSNQKRLHIVADVRLRSNMACLPVFCSACNQTIKQNCGEVLLGASMINYSRPSARYVDHVFEELGVRSWSRAMILNSSNICWSAVVTFVPASIETDSIQFPFQLFQHCLGTFPDLSEKLDAINKHRQVRCVFPLH